MRLHTWRSSWFGAYKLNVINTNNKVYILNLKGSVSFLIWEIFSLYKGLNQEPLDLESDDIPMCHHASLEGGGIKHISRKC